MITTRHTSNIDQVLASVQGLATDGPSDHTLVIRNVAYYAVYLQAKEAYWVLNDDVLREKVQEAFERKLTELSRRGLLLTGGAIIEAFREAAAEVVAHYQSVIGSSDTPGKVKLPPRPVHPGGFADDTEHLAGSYQSLLDGGPVTTYPYP